MKEIEMLVEFYDIYNKKNIGKPEMYLKKFNINIDK